MVSKERQTQSGTSIFTAEDAEDDASLIQSDALRLVRATLGKNKYPEWQVGIDTFDNSDIIKIANGVDLRLKKAHIESKGLSYERKCFNEIVKADPNSIILGPNLTDYLMNLPATASFKKPDALKFEKNQGNWILSELYEFKSSNRNHEFFKKTYSLREMLNQFRANPRYLPTIFTASLSAVIETPRQVVVPANKNITLTFVYPIKASLATSVNLPFQTKYKRVRR